MTKKIINNLESYAVIRGKINDNFTDLYDNKVDKVIGKELIETTKITKLDGVAENAQVNIIEDIKVNGTTLTPSSKSVDIDIPIVIAGNNITVVEDDVNHTITINATSGSSGGSTVTDSATNGNIVVDGSEVVVYELPSDVAKTTDIPNVNNKLEAVNIKEGTNVTVSVNGNDVTINSTATGGSVITDSETNGNIIIDDVETNVYTLPSDVVVDADLLEYAKTTDIPNVSTKLEATNIKAGTNITLSVSGNDVTINSTASGSGSSSVTDSTTNGNIMVDGSELVVYEHPLTHDASMIVQDADNRFVTDTEKTTWNSKVGINDTTPTLTEAYSGVKTQGLIDNITPETATNTSLGIIKGGGNINVSIDGTISVPAIGDLTQLNTTSNTDLVVAINEINAKPIGGGSAEATTYSNITSGLTATNVQSAIDELEARPISSTAPWVYVDDYKYLAVTLAPLVDGLDWTIPIQTAINSLVDTGGVVVLGKGIHYITSALTIPRKGISVIGMGVGVTEVWTVTNTINCFELASEISQEVISDMSLSSYGGIGDSNAGIKFADDSGGFGNLLKNLYINYFRYGIKAKNTWWNNTIENVMINVCGTSFVCDCTNGQSINNLFLRMYSNGPTVAGWIFGNTKAWTFIDCNNGGHPTNTTMYALISGGNPALKMIGCNFEGATIAANTAGITVYGTTKLSMSGCTFMSNKGVSATAYEIQMRDTSQLTIDGFYQSTANAYMSQLNLINTATAIILDDSVTNIKNSDGTSVNSLSKPRTAMSCKAIDLSGVEQTVMIFTPTSTGKIKNIKIIYTEATSTDTGKSFVVKTNDGVTYCAQMSAVSAAAFSTVDVVPLNTNLWKNTSVILYTGGGKVGTGEIMVQIEYVLD